MSDAKELWELGIQKGTLDERQRIIDLLESLKGMRVPDKHLGLHFIAIDEAIDWITYKDD